MKLRIRLEDRPEIGIVANAKIITSRGESRVVVVIATDKSEKNCKIQQETNPIKQTEEVFLYRGNVLAVQY